MKFNLLKTEIQTAINRLSAIAVSKTMPILQCVKITAGAFPTFEASDLEQTLRYTFDTAVCESDGACCVNTKRLQEIISVCKKDDTLTFELDDRGLNVKTSASKYRIAVMSVDDFPNLQAVEGDLHQVKALELMATIDKVLFAASTDEGRFNLASVAVGPGYMTTTDGHRLAYCPQDIVATESIRLLPQRSAQRLVAVLKDCGDININFGLSDKFTVIQAGLFEYQTRLIDGDYPPWEKVIPKSDCVQVVCNTEDLLNAVKSIAIMKSDTNKGATFDFEPGKLSISMQDFFSDGQSSIDIEGDITRTIKINTAYVMDALNVIGSDSVILEIRDEGMPIIFRPTGADWYNLIMPMRM